MNKREIPKPVISSVAKHLASFYTHAELNLMFDDIDAPGEPPEGTKVQKVAAWLKRINVTNETRPLESLGQLIENYMDEVIDPAALFGSERGPGREHIQETLSRYGLSYQFGGKILGNTLSAPSKSLNELLLARDLTGVRAEFDRALASVESDPAATLTAACSIVETLCSLVIEKEGIEPPRTLDVQNLWKAVQKHLRLDPADLVNDDLKKITSGLATTIGGLGALRTHAGTAHGGGSVRYKVEPRHARLAAHSAHTIVLFVLEVWDTKRAKEAA